MNNRQQSQAGRNKRPHHSDPCGAFQGPTHLKGEALTEWNRVVPLPERMGKLTELDRVTLTLYCETWQMYLEAQAELTRAGTLYHKTKNGYLTPHTAIGPRNKGDHCAPALLGLTGPLAARS
ncbi:MAG: phage terminase small subunit P27 family [Pirellulales bacterium]